MLLYSIIVMLLLDVSDFIKISKIPFWLIYFNNCVYFFELYASSDIVNKNLRAIFNISPAHEGEKFLLFNCCTNC